MGSTIDFNPNISKDIDSTSTGKKEKTDNSFGLEEFYKLLAVQLQNQDMMNPVDDSQMVAQMAQMATIQAMEQMNQMTMTSYAFSFMGKDVIISDYDDLGQSVTYTGPVEKVVLYNGKPQVYVNGKAFELSQVMEVITPEAETSMDLVDLIGRNVAVQVVDEEKSTDKETIYKLIYGVVDKVTRYDGKTMVSVGEKSYLPGQIVEVLPDGKLPDDEKNEQTEPAFLKAGLGDNNNVHGNSDEGTTAKENGSDYHGEQGVDVPPTSESSKDVPDKNTIETDKVEETSSAGNQAMDNKY